MRQQAPEGFPINERENAMLKKNLTTLFAVALVVLAVPALAQAGDDVDIANDNALYFVSAGDTAQDDATLEYSEAFGDVYDDAVISFMQGVDKDEQPGALGTVDYTQPGAWALSCDNYL